MARCGGIVCVAISVFLGAAEARTEPAHQERLDQPPAPTAETAQPRAVAAPVLRGHHRSIQVNVDAAGLDIVGDAANEPTIAINPLDPGNIVIGWRQFGSISSNFRQAGRAYSFDAGESWTFPGALQPTQFRSDPVLDADSSGTFYYYSLSSTTSTEFFVSVDGGISWDGPRPSYGGDKNWLAVDATGGIGDGHVYTIWNSQFTCCAPGTDFARSVNGAVTHQGPFAMPEKLRWGTIDVGPEGEVYVVGIPASVTLGTTALVRSTAARDALLAPTFDLTRAVPLGGRTSYGLTPNPAGLAGQLWVATDHSTGPTRGNVYVLGSVATSGFDPLDVRISRSEDGGLTWTPSLRIHDDPAGSAYQWFGTLSVAPDGRLDAVWNDTRIHYSGVMSEVYYAWSKDEGRTWSAGLPVTPPWDSTIGWPQQQKIGDYYHMISDARGAGLAFSATFRGGQDVYFLRVGDCNANGVHDSADITSGTSADCNQNRVADECEPIPPCTGCNADGVCDPGESCQNCPADCPLPGCGNGVCEPTVGEDCLSCPGDCAGQQSGSPTERFCCGDGEGTNPVGCADSRCVATGLRCASVDSCCGDAVCEGIEDAASCRADCEPFDDDLDGARNIFDCEPLDPSVFAVPGEVRNVRWLADKATLMWDSQSGTAGSGTSYDVVRGGLAGLPVGGGTEICAGSWVIGTTLVVAAEPPPGEGWYFLVAAHNGCGAGDYGADSTGTPRTTLACGL